MESHTKKKGSIASVFRVYGRHIAQYRASFLVVTISTIGLQIVSLAIPLYLRSFFNILASNTPNATTIHQLMMIVGILSVVWGVQWLLNRIEYVGEMHFVVEIMTELNFTAFDYLIGHSYQFFTSNFAGSLTHKVNKFSRAFEILVSSILLDFFPTVLFVVGAVGILYVHNHTLGTVLGVWSVLFTIFQIYVAKLRHPSRIAAAEADTKVTAVLADSISNHMTTLLFSGERYESGLFRNAISARRDAVMHIWKVDNYIWAIFGLFTVVIEIGLLYGATIF
jgi:ABC-type multidrug transport system fused ATPase/permease subunit